MKNDFKEGNIIKEHKQITIAFGGLIFFVATGLIFLTDSDSTLLVCLIILIFCSYIITLSFVTNTTLGLVKEIRKLEWKIEKLENTV